MKKRTDYPSGQLDQFQLRLPKGWRDRIKQEAARNHRPMNGEILAAIETAMRIKGVQLEAS
ncbi:Arc family DNA-binding protein (plasmid) [Paracoccus sp. TD-10]|uniref:Arc family DNA-binding protein n=1 Tax=Paracoccus sp. TD-10 TaxID=3395918 RepID=UPI003AAB0666